MCARLRPDTDRLADPAQAAKTALRSLGRRIARLGSEADELERQLDQLVAAAAPSTVSRLGCGTHHTATLLVAAGENIDRLGSEASFAHLCATAPVPASSGRTSRHRLNFAGNRAANRALHIIVIVRLREPPRGTPLTARNPVHTTYVNPGRFIPGQVSHCSAMLVEWHPLSQRLSNGQHPAQPGR